MFFQDWETGPTKELPPDAYRAEFLPAQENGSSSGPSNSLRFSFWLTQRSGGAAASLLENDIARTNVCDPKDIQMSGGFGN